MHIQNVRTFIYDQSEQAKFLLFLYTLEKQSHKVYQTSFCFGMEHTLSIRCVYCQRINLLFEIKVWCSKQMESPKLKQERLIEINASDLKEPLPITTHQVIFDSHNSTEKLIKQLFVFQTAAERSLTEPAAEPMEKGGLLLQPPPSRDAPLHKHSPRCLGSPSGWRTPPHVPPRKTHLWINNENFSPSEGARGFGKDWHDRNLNAAGIYLHFTCSQLEASPHFTF